VLQWFWTWRCAALLCVLSLILLATIVITTVYFTHQPVAPIFPKIPDSSLEGNPIWKIFRVANAQVNCYLIVQN